MKLRIRYTKLGKIRFVGHRDLARCWERALRRVDLPMAYTEGFSPRPKMHYGLALPTGAESHAEYLDVDLSAPVDLTGLDAALSAALPDGVEVTGISAVASNATALQAVVDTVTWELEFEGVTPDDLAAVAARVLAADDVPLTFERKGKELTENVRPALLALTVAPDPVDGAALLTAELATRPRSVRPGELAICLGEPGNVRRVRRIEQWMTIDGVALPPLAAGDPSSPVDDRLAS